MKYFIIFLAALSCFFSAQANPQIPLPIIYLNLNSAVHVRSPQSIRYVDLPKAKIKGDLPLKNLLRLKMSEEASYAPGEELGILTITGESFLSQYRLIYLGQDSHSYPSELEILPSNMLPLLPSKLSLSSDQLRKKALAVIAERVSSPLASAGQQGISIKLNRILSCDDFVFLDLTFSNSSSLSFNIASLEFSIADKKILKATNFQKFGLSPQFILNPLENFSRRARNIYVLPKAAFSASKQLIITLTEAQPSSRQVELKLSYRDVLAADSF